MPKIIDILFTTPAPFNFPPPGLCRLRLYYSLEHGVTALLTDLGDKNPGRTLTNSIEYVRQALLEGGFIDERARIIEHHEVGLDDSRAFLDVTFKGADPYWDPIALETVVRLVDTTVEELTEDTLSNARLRGQIERARNRIDPFLDSPELEAPKVVRRREAIRKRMLDRQVLVELVESGAGERALQELLKQDLSLLADVYANPVDEYICFSEFQVGEGRVDFAVFTGRSRMDVILIEIKGADFLFTNAGSYGNVAAKINEAIQQLRRRFRDVYDEYKAFRRRVHQLRRDIEMGVAIPNTLLGPYQRLEVDPNKDVKIHCVVIGGRTRDNVKDSQLRNDFEFQTKPAVRVETWDTWIEKISRNRAY